MDMNEKVHKRLDISLIVLRNLYFSAYDVLKKLA
jgi:hypothetical protein